VRNDIVTKYLRLTVGGAHALFAPPLCPHHAVLLESADRARYMNAVPDLTLSSPAKRNGIGDGGSGGLSHRAPGSVAKAD
jgi:hypothetical protein